MQLGGQIPQVGTDCMAREPARRASWEWARGRRGAREKGGLMDDGERRETREERGEAERTAARKVG